MTFEVVIGDRTTLEVWLYDVDGDTEELMGEYSADALGHVPWLTIETLRQGGLTISIPSRNADVPQEVRLVFRPL